MNNRTIYAAVAFVILILGSIVVGTTVMGIYNTGVEYQTRLTAMYQSNQNELSTYVTSIYEQIGVANLKTAKMDTIITHAVQGRYGEDGFSADGAFFSAVSEAYPDLDLSIYDEIRRSVEAGRTAFKVKQDMLLDVIRSFDTYRQGMPRGLVAEFFFPNDNLQARIGGEVVAVGDAALSQMRVLVLNGEAVESFQTGTTEPLIR